jgi:hypothetical protein
VDRVHQKRGRKALHPKLPVSELQNSSKPPLQATSPGKSVTKAPHLRDSVPLTFKPLPETFWTSNSNQQRDGKVPHPPFVKTTDDNRWKRDKTVDTDDQMDSNTQTTNNNQPQNMDQGSSDQGASMTGKTGWNSSKKQQGNSRSNTEHSSGFANAKTNGSSSLELDTNHNHNSVHSNRKQNLEARSATAVQNLPQTTKDWLSQVVAIAERQVVHWREKLTADKESAKNDFKQSSASTVYAWLTRMFQICQTRVEAALKGSQDEQDSWQNRGSDHKSEDTHPEEMYERLPLGVAILNLQQVFNSSDSTRPLINAAMAHLLDYPRDELSRMYSSLCGIAKIYPIENVAAVIEQFCNTVMQEKSGFSLKSRLVNKSGSILQVVESVKLTYHYTGIPTHVTLMYQLIQDSPNQPRNSQSTSTSTSTRQPMDDSTDQQQSNSNNSNNNDTGSGRMKLFLAIGNMNAQQKPQSEQQNMEAQATFANNNAPSSASRSFMHNNNNNRNYNHNSINTSNNNDNNDNNDNRSPQNAQKSGNEFMEPDSMSPLDPRRVYSDPHGSLMQDFVGSGRTKDKNYSNFGSQSAKQ